MSIEMHLKVGPLLHGLCNSRLPKRVHDAVGVVRSELDNWVMAEYPGDAMSQEQFLAMYYGEYVGPIEGAAAQLRTISEVHALLKQGYADCPPLKSLLKLLEKARIGFGKSGCPAGKQADANDDQIPRDEILVDASALEHA